MFFKVWKCSQENTWAGVTFSYSCRAGGLQLYYNTRRFQHKYFLVNIVKFLRTPILKNICEELLLYICRPLFNQKHNMEWFLLQRFVDLVRIYFLLIVSRNHSNRVNTVLIPGFRQIYAGCYPLHNVYFNDMQKQVAKFKRWRTPFYIKHPDDDYKNS